MRADRQTDRHTDKQTDTLTTIVRSRRGPSNRHEQSLTADAAGIFLRLRNLEREHFNQHWDISFKFVDE